MSGFTFVNFYRYPDESNYPSHPVMDPNTYATDYAFEFDDGVSVPLGEYGTYYFTYTVLNVTSAAPFGSPFYWKIDYPEGSSTVAVYEDNGSGWVFQGNADPAGFGLKNVQPVESNVIPTYLTFGLQYLIDNVPGTYYVQRVISKDGSSTTDYSTNQFQIRMLAAVNLQGTRFNPQTFSPPAITGNWAALPAGWQPTSATIETEVQITFPNYSGTPVYEYFYSVPVTAPSGSGIVGSFSYAWPGIGGLFDSMVEGQFEVLVTGFADVPGGAVTQSDNDNWPGASAVVCTCCFCLDGSCKKQYSQAMLANPAGPNMDAVFYYNSINNAKVPASLGYGWSCITNVNVMTDLSGNILYQDESANLLRWTLVSGAYVPYSKGNYVTATLSGGQYTLTFQDSSQRIFDAASGRFLQEVDRNGNPVNYSILTDGNLQVQDGTGTRTVVYDITSRPDGQPASVTANGRTVTLNYYSDTDPVSPNRLQSIVSPAGEVTSFTYDPVSLNIYQIIEPPAQGTGSVSWTYIYDDIGRVLEEVHYDSLTLYYYGVSGYDNFADDATVTVVQQDLTLASPSRMTTSYFGLWPDFESYSLLANVQLSVELVDANAVGTGFNKTFMEYNDPNNPYLVTLITDPNLNTTAMTYNIQGNLKTYIDAQDNETLYTYAEDIGDTNPKHANLLVRVDRAAVPVNDVATNYSTYIFYDVSGNPLSVQDATFGSNFAKFNSDGTVSALTDGNNCATTMEYDSSTKNLISTTVPSEPSDPLGSTRTTRFGLNDWDDVIAVSDPLGFTTVLQRDLDSRIIQVINPLGNAVRSTIVQSLLTQITSAANRNTYVLYDGAFRVFAIEQDINSTTQQLRVQYRYNGFSDVIQQRRPSLGSLSVYSTNYDALGRTTTQLDPLNRLTLVNYAPYCNNYTVSTARGIQRVFTLDSLCRLTQIATQREIRNFNFDNLSRLSSDSNGGRYAWETFSGVEVGAAYGLSVSANGRTYTWDGVDQLLQTVFPDGSTVVKRYSKVGQLIQQIDNFAVVTNYSYFKDRRLATVSFVGTGGTSTFKNQYDLAGRPSQIAFPSSTNIVQEFSDASGNSGWDGAGRLLLTRYLKSGANLQTFQYVNDLLGRRIALLDTPASPGTPVNWQYGYSWLDQLISAQNGTESNVYSYDTSDNRSSLTQGASVTYSTYDVADQIWFRVKDDVEIDSYTHDLDGNMSSRYNYATGVTTNYAWTDFNNLTVISDPSTQELDFYDAGDIRRLKSPDGTNDNNTNYFNSGAMPISETRPTVGPVSFIQGGGLLGLQEGGAQYFFITDALSSVRLVVDSTGTVQASFSTDEFGVATSSTGSPDLAGMTYVGGAGMRNEPNEADAPLYYARRRWYNSSLGRFLNQDPIGFSGGLNLYNYPLNPINLIDAGGLQAAPEDILFEDATGIGKYQAGAFSDALGILTRGGYGSTAKWAQGFDNRGGYKIDKCNGYTKQQGAGAFTKEGAYTVLNQFFFPLNGYYQSMGISPDARFLNALALAAAIVHERDHYLGTDQPAGCKTRETKPWNDALKFLSQLYYKLSLSDPHRADLVWRYGLGLQNLAKTLVTQGHIDDQLTYPFGGENPIAPASPI